MSDVLARAKRYLDRAVQYVELANVTQEKRKAERYREIADLYITLGESDLRLIGEIERGRVTP